ncbi:hypothetical protein D3C81_07350 [compost metagenome]
MLEVGTNLRLYDSVISEGLTYNEGARQINKYWPYYMLNEDKTELHFYSKNREYCIMTEDFEIKKISNYKPEEGTKWSLVTISYILVRLLSKKGVM